MTLSAALAPSLPGRTNFILSLSSLFPGQKYTLQSTTNLGATAWSTETNFTATQAATGFTNSTGGSGQKFYRVVPGTH